jgi:hypothetical protein
MAIDGAQDRRRKNRTTENSGPEYRNQVGLHAPQIVATSGIRVVVSDRPQMSGNGPVQVRRREMVCDATLGVSQEIDLQLMLRSPHRPSLISSLDEARQGSAEDSACNLTHPRACPRFDDDVSEQTL